MCAAYRLKDLNPEAGYSLQTLTDLSPQPGYCLQTLTGLLQNHVFDLL